MKQYKYKMNKVKGTNFKNWFHVCYLFFINATFCQKKCNFTILLVNALITMVLITGNILMTIHMEKEL